MAQYTMNDYDRAEEDMTDEDEILLIEYIKRGHLPDYNFTGNEEDYENYKLHIVLKRAINRIKSKST